MKKHDTPMLDELENGPWPSFISGIKRLRDTHPETRINEMTNDLLGQLEHSYETRKGYWKGGTVSVYGYGGGIIPRFSEVGDAFPKSKEFHTLRVQPPAGNFYTTQSLRDLADSWEKHGSGLVTFHGQTGNIMFIGSTTDSTQHFFDDINEKGWDLGGAGPCVRTAMSCVGAGRCEMSNVNEHKAHRLLVNNFIDDMHRPALPYKFKFKVSGCANDCMNSIERADMSVIGTWRDDIKVDQEEFKAYVGLKGRKYVIDNIVTRCPTNAISLNDDDSVSIDNQNCVKCMHCLNVVPKALHPGDERGGGGQPCRKSFRRHQGLVAEGVSADRSGDGRAESQSAELFRRGRAGCLCPEQRRPGYRPVAGSHASGAGIRLRRCPSLPRRHQPSAASGQCAALPGPQLSA